MNWLKESKARFKINQPLKAYTTFRIGGRCRYFFEPKDLDSLIVLIKSLKRNKQSVFILGSGSNILVSDKGVNAAVIRLSAPYFKQIAVKKGFVVAAAGCSLSRFMFFSASRGFSGHEFLSGIPGTVGGGLIMNAGQGKDFCSIGDLVEEVQVMDYNGNIKQLKKNNLKFSYRRSNLSKYIVLAAKFKLARRGKKSIYGKIKDYLVERNASQDTLSHSAGCIFKNPGSVSAGSLIDACGLKGKKAGGACISEKHANFIINKNNASAKDVLSLIRLVKKEVKNKFGIDLTTEIRIWQ